MNAPNGAPRAAPASAAPALAAVSAAALAAAVDRGAFAAVVESLRADLWLTDFRLGGLVAAAGIAGLALAPAFAAAARRRAPARVRAAGLALAAAGTMLSGAARRGIAILAARLATAAGVAARAGAEVAEPPAPDAGAVVAGTAAGYALGAVASRLVGRRWALVAAGVPGLFAASAALRARGAAPAPVPALPWRGEEGLVAELRRLRADRARLLAVVGQGATAFAAAATAFWTPAFLERSRGVPRAIAGVTFAVVFLVAGLAGSAAGARAIEAVRTRAAGAERWVAGGAALVAAPLAIAAYAGWRPRTYLPALVLSQLLLFAAARAGGAAVAASTPAVGGARAAVAAAVALALFAEAPAPALVGLLSDRTSLGRALAVLVPLALALGAAAWLGAAWRTGAARERPGGAGRSAR